MKINKIYISAFGGLKDFTLELNDGLNVIYGDNEDGKSTVAAFIKAMFFGTGRNSKNIADSVRLKYTPWDCSVMAGKIYFTHENKNYCLEREFRKSDSTDQIRLIDTNLGKAVDFGDSVGVTFFGMSAAAFERTLFINSGGDFKNDSDATGEINKRLSNIAVTGSEDTSYQKIQKTLSDAKNKVISKSGKVGSYAEDMRLYEDLKDRLITADCDARKKAELNQNIAKNKAKYDEVVKKKLSVKKIIAQENDLKNREKIEEYLNAKKELDELNVSLRLQDGTTLDESLIKKIDFGVNKCEKLADRCKELESDIQKIKESIELQNQNSPESASKQIEELNLKVTELTAKKDTLTADEENAKKSLTTAQQKLETAKSQKSVFNIPLFVLSVVILALAIVLSIFAKPVILGISTLAVGAVLIALSFVLKPKTTAAILNAQTEISNLNATINDIKTNKNLVAEEINNTNARINTLSTIINADVAVKAQRQSDLNDKLSDLSCEKQKLNDALGEINEYMSRFENSDTLQDIKLRIDGLKNEIEKQKQLKLQLAYLSKDLGNISYEDAAQKLALIQNGENINTADIENAKAELEALNEQISLLKDNITASLTELKTSFRHSENPEDIRREINAAQERLIAKKEFCDAVDIALSILQDSFNEVRSGFGSELETQTQAIFSGLTDKKYSNVTVSDTLDMTVEQREIFGTRELDFLSLGTTHQAYLSLRLAITKLISNENSLPVFLDDSLAQYDDKRTEKAIQFLKDFCQNGQGVLFTCHNSICEIAKNQGIEVKKPYN